jgi:hypothetical protein
MRSRKLQTHLEKLQQFSQNYQLERTQHLSIWNNNKKIKNRLPWNEAACSHPRVLLLLLLPPPRGRRFLRMILGKD